MITVALPNHANPIAWLAMESLKRQRTNHDWELIVFEDSDDPLGKEFYTSFDLGVRVVYIYQEERIALNQKWLKMMELADPSSLGIILQGSDDYSEPYRVENAYSALTNGVDWFRTTKGMFYNIKNRRTMFFNQRTGTGLNMAISRRAIEAMPTDFKKWSGVDSWLYANLPSDAKIACDDSENWTGGLFTDGFNRLSTSRRDMYKKPKTPFVKTGIKIDSLTLPTEIIKRLKRL